MRAVNEATERGEWRAAAWWMVRRHPDLYGSEQKRIREIEKLQADITRKESGPPLTDEQRVAVLTALLGRMGLALVLADRAPPAIGC